LRRLRIDFINNLNPNHLSTGQGSLALEQEWILLRENKEEKLANASGNLPPINVTTTIKKSKSAENVPTKPTEVNNSSINLLDDLPFSQRYKFWNVSADEISRDDIPELLADYKRLVLVEFLANKKS